MEYLDDLTPAERRVYDQLITTKSYIEIMADLGLTIGGVRFHVNNIFNKTGFESRLDIVCDYYQESDRVLIIPNNIDLTIHRDSEVFTLAVNGHKLIHSARIMGVSETFIRISRARIYKKVGVKNTLELVHKCYGVEV